MPQINIMINYIRTIPHINILKTKSREMHCNIISRGVCVCVDKPRLTHSGFRLVLLLFSRPINISPVHYKCMVGVRFISQRRVCGSPIVDKYLNLSIYILYNPMVVYAYYVLQYIQQTYYIYRHADEPIDIPTV